MKVWTLTTETSNGDIATAVATTEEQVLEAFGAALDGWVEDEVVDALTDPAEAERIAREQASFLTVELVEHDLQDPLREKVTEFAATLDREADEISPPLEEDDAPYTCDYGCEDKTFDDIDDLIDHAWEKHGVRDYHVEKDLDDDSQALEAETLRQTAQRIKEILEAAS